MRAGLAIVAVWLSACEAREPAVDAEAARAALSARAKTALVAVEVDAAGAATLRFATLKEFPYRAPLPIDADLRVSVFEPGSAEPLGRGEARVPELCTCGAAAPHARGDVALRHDDTVLVKVPYLTGRERLEIERRTPGEGWVTVASGWLSGADDARR